MRIGIFGGTFDPVHVGHLIMAEQCREQARLDQIWFIPAARPPHKKEQVLTAFDKRVEMLRLAIAGQPAFEVNEVEATRPGPSYTAETLAELQTNFPGAQFQLIIGSDCLPDLPHWYQPSRIVELAGLLIVTRPGWPTWPVETLPKELGLPHGSSLQQQIVPIPLIEISSSDLRQRVAAGRSIRYMVPKAVECYIETHRLFAPGG